MTPLALHRSREVATRGTSAQMSLDPAAAQNAAVAGGDVAAHELTGQRSSAFGVDQRLARLIDRLARRTGGNAEDRCDLVMAQAAHLA